MASMGIWITLKQTGAVATPLLLTDIDVGEGGRKGAGRGGNPRSGPVYVPTSGSVDLYYTSTVALSYEEGCIRGFVNLGYLTATFHVGPDVLGSFWGWADYNDLATQTVPLVVPASVWTTLPCDGLGPQTNRAFLPTGVSDFYNTATSSVVLTQVPIGAMVRTRLDFYITPSVNNSAMETRLYFPSFGGWELAKMLPRLDLGAGIEYHLLDDFRFYIGSPDVQTNGALIQVRCSSASTVRVMGFFIDMV